MALPQIGRNGCQLPHLTKSGELLQANSMKITVIGTGYVGLVSGTCFAEMGIDVTCVDVDAAKIDALRSGVVPIYEPGLDELIRKNMECGRLHFSTSLPDSLRNSEVVFIAVGTPAREDGSADLHYVFDVAAEIGETLDHYTVVVTKSTVPVGTSFKVKSLIADALSRRGATVDFDIANNPEFLKEGAAIKDFMSPDRVVIGVENERAEKIMRRLYKPFIVVNDRIQITDIASSEMIKYASNAMLATRISFMNDIANLCELVGADFNKVRKGVGSDTRIGNKFLYAGCGYGGSCFPKDVKALVSTAERYGYEMRVLKAVEDVNQRQKQILFDKLVRRFGSNLNGKKITLWGIAFKPETDDIREAPAMVIIRRLLDSGASVSVYDPAAMDECRRIFGSDLTFAPDKYTALQHSDALLLVTEWKEFRLPDFLRMRSLMRTPLLLDGRNIFDRDEVLSAGFEYEKIG